MKLLVSTILASLAMVNGEGETAPSDLANRWNLEKPVVVYDATENKFDLHWDQASTQNTADNTRATFYDYKCKDDGTDGFVEYILPQTGAGITVTPIVMDPTPKLNFTMDVQMLADNPNIYSEISGDPLQDDFIATEDNGITDEDIGSGVMQMCLRFDIGYDNDDGEFQSVNFVESILQVKFDLTVGFNVTAFSVAPKERVTTTTVKDNYELVGYLCTPSSMTTIDGRSVPALYTQGVSNPAFNQGALISVCVRPSQTSVSDGIIIDSITSYDWERGAITQPAVENGSDAGNGLTVHTCTTTGYFCTIESILFAEFFATSGTVSGTGAAQLAFDPVGTSRRLDDPNVFIARRRLEEQDALAEFDVEVNAIAGSDGPGALRTAGGASMGVTVLVALAGLFGASLLA